MQQCSLWQICLALDLDENWQSLLSVKQPYWQLISNFDGRILLSLRDARCKNTPSFSPENVSIVAFPGYSYHLSIETFAPRAHFSKLRGQCIASRHWVCYSNPILPSQPCTLLGRFQWCCCPFSEVGCFWLAKRLYITEGELMKPFLGYHLQVILSHLDTHMCVQYILVYAYLGKMNG